MKQLYVKNVEVFDGYTYDTIKEKIVIEAEITLYLNKTITYSVLLEYFYEREWNIVFKGWKCEGRQPWLHESSAREKEILNKILNSKAFLTKKKEIDRIISEHKTKKKLHEFKVVKQSVRAEMNMISLDFETVNTPQTQFGTIVFTKHIDTWIINQFFYNDKSYLGFSSDFSEVVKDELKLLFLVS